MPSSNVTRARVVEDRRHVVDDGDHVRVERIARTCRSAPATPASAVTIRYDDAVPCASASPHDVEQNDQHEDAAPAESRRPRRLCVML